MRGETSTRGPVRAWLAGTAALLFHVGVWQLAPSAPPPAPSAFRDESALWLTVKSDVPAEQPSPGAGVAAVVTTPARAPSRRAARSREKAASPVPAQTGDQVATAGSAEGVDLPEAASSPSADEPGSQAIASLAAVRGPGLLAVPSPCRGFFPAQARVDRGAVQISVRVDELGRARLDRLLMEMPRGHGFGGAAHACAAALRFAPAVNSQGMAVAGEAKLELTFSRS